MELSAILISSVMFVSTMPAVERSTDWDKYEVYGEQKRVSYAVSACMARKTLKIEAGAAYSYAEPFYLLCMKNHSDSAQQYSAHFKSQTIGRFLYILRRTDEALDKTDQ